MKMAVVRIKAAVAAVDHYNKGLTLDLVLVIKRVEYIWKNISFNHFRRIPR